MNFRYRIIYFLLGLFSFYSVSVFSQQSIVESNFYTDFKKALTLFNSKAYTSAQMEFEKIKTYAPKTSTIYVESSYYEAICAIKLNQAKADDKVLDFVKNNPTSSKKNKAFLNVGNHYFSNRKPAYALKWYIKVDRSLLNKNDRNTLDFKMGYGLLVANNLSDAKEKFFSLMKDEIYGDDSRYYYGYIAYKLEDYMLAKATFKDIMNNESYKSKISYYLLDINFKSGDFEKCIKAGKEIIGSSNKNEASEVSKIIGESYFNLGKYKESIPYLKAYKGKRGKWANNDFYQVGYAYYKINDYKQAVSYFNKIIGLKDALAQNAYYHLAECYLKLKQKSEALNAFKAASEMSFDKTLQEDASLNYAKLSYEEGNAFEEVSIVLQNFLEKYPKSNSYDEINQLVVSSFLHQKDYEGALAYLNKKNRKQNTVLKNEISLYRGIQLFNLENYNEAIPYFKNAQMANANEIRNSAKFWEADALFNLGQYSKALKQFEEFERTNRNQNKEFINLKYNIGYCYFKLNDYQKAAISFTQFIQYSNLDKSVLNDAYLRLGDSYYAIAEYSKAIRFYENAVNNYAIKSDYAQFQIGMSYGFLGDDVAKISALDKVVKDYVASMLKDDALYQLASTYTKVKQNEKAHETYEQLLKEHPNSIFIPKALVRQGLLYYNQNNNQKALALFKRTVSRFPNTSDAIEAVRNAKNIYVDQDQLDEYVSWTKTLSFVDISESEIEKSTFLIAQKKYLENKNNEAITSLENYLLNYSNYPNSLKVKYYLGDTYFSIKEFDKAEVNYKSVIEEGLNDYREKSLSKLSEIYLQNNRPKEAIPYLELLSKEAYEAENILFAQSNLMNVYYDTENYTKAVSLAKKVLENSTINPDLELDAQKIIARTAFANEDLETAIGYYALIEEKAEGELKVEAIYHRAYYNHIEKRYQESNEIIQELIANYSAYKYWGVKSYLIMAKNYYKLKDAYQATFILENVIKNFNQFEDLINEANIELDSIKRKEAAVNKSVNPQNK